VANRPQGLSKAEAQKKVLAGIAAGLSVAEACEQAQRTVKAHENWRATDPDYARAVDEARFNRAQAVKQGKDADVSNIDFETFCRDFLNQPLYPHQKIWVDVLEGKKEPELHDSMTYKPGDKSRVLINVPPNHAKSMTLTIQYALYRLCMDPNIRIIIVSKTQQLAKDFLWAIKQRLTSPRWAALQAAFGGPNGFKSSESGWSADRIYLSDELRTSGEKDPNIQAIGLSGQIYGARADLIIVDDAVTLTNAAEYEKQIRWLTQEVASRLPGAGGRLLVIGTRVAPVDLYSELLNPDRFISGKSPWTHLAMPAVLSYAEDPNDWETLWPVAQEPWDGSENAEPDENGNYPRWDGYHLSRVRDQIPARIWALTYMQLGVSEDSVFDPICINGSQDKRRRPGLLVPGAIDHPRRGMEGLYTILSLDPAMAGDSFAIVMAVDRQTQKRYVLQAWVQHSPTPEWIRNLIKSVAVEYSVNEVVVETNAFQLFLFHDPEVNEFLRQRGIRMQPHYTGRNKQDPDFGVASVAPLFGSTRGVNDGAGRKVHSGDNLIHLPRVDDSEGLKALVEQLITWQPGVRGNKLKMDGPMALWFAELRAREMLHVGKNIQHFTKNPYASKRDRASRVVVPLADYGSYTG
jgi:hypothetical protein